MVFRRMGKWVGEGAGAGRGTPRPTSARHARRSSLDRAARHANTHGLGSSPTSRREGLELRGDLGREALELLELVEDRVEHEEAGPALDELAEPVNALGRLAPDRDLLGQLAPAEEGPDQSGEPRPRPPPGAAPPRICARARPDPG